MNTAKRKFDNEGSYLKKFFSKKIRHNKKKIQIIIEDNNNYLPIKKYLHIQKKANYSKINNFKKNEKFEIDKGLKNISKNQTVYPLETHF